MKKGVLYYSGGKRGEVRISRIVKALKSVAWFLKGIGIGLLTLSVVGVFFIYVPLISANVRYSISKFQSLGPKQLSSVEGRSELNRAVVEEKPNWEVPDNEYSIYIPKIDARSRVIGNVNAASEKEYGQALKQGVAAAGGLSVPGKIGTTYLFAHSTDSPANFARYNAVFYLLDKMETGDGVEIVYRGKLFKYEVVNREILPARDVGYLVPQNDEEKLILQTCYPPGTTWKRLIVTAKRIK